MILLKVGYTWTNTFFKIQGRKKDNCLYNAWTSFTLINPGYHTLINVKMENSQWELNLWGVSQSSHTINWKNFDFSLISFPIVDSYENMDKDLQFQLNIIKHWVMSKGHENVCTCCWNVYWLNSEKYHSKKRFWWFLIHESIHFLYLNTLKFLCSLWKHFTSKQIHSYFF